MEPELRGYHLKADEMVTIEIYEHMKFLEDEYYVPIVSIEYQHESMRLVSLIEQYRLALQLHFGRLSVDTIALFDTRNPDWLKYWKDRDDIVRQLKMNLHDILICTAPGTSYPRVMFFRDDYAVDYRTSDLKRGIYWLDDIAYEYQATPADKRISHSLSWFMFEKGLSEVAMNYIYDYPLF